MKAIHSIITSLLLCGCSYSQTQTQEIDASQPKDSVPVNLYNSSPKTNLGKSTLDNNSSLKMDSTEQSAVFSKLNRRQIRVVHTFVPLCDNKNQGIAPVSASLGNGLNLNTNLYWGARYGIKTYFNLKKDWKLEKSIKNLNSNILERVIFKKKIKDKTIYLVADAYRGDRMKACLNSFIGSISGTAKDSINLETEKIGILGAANLLVFNGHNGLMECEIESLNNTDENQRDAAAICCISNPYFEDYFTKAKANKVLTTTSLLAPEAYILEALITSWAKEESSSLLHSQVAKAYNTYQRCGINGAMNLFRTE